jgi:hypothetical protein
VGPSDGSSAAGLDDHIGQSEAQEVLAHVISNVRPDAQEDALALVITGPILVGLAKISRGDRPVHGGHNLRQGDGFGRAG